jgi:hypothetical protein
MARQDGFDLTAGGNKIGSFQTGLQDDGTREMFVFGRDVHLHFGAVVVEGALGRSFAQPSTTSGATKTYTGSGVIRDERSTEALATFVVEEQAPGGPKTIQFTQGQYETALVTVPDMKLVREVKALPWPDGSRRAEYLLSVYDKDSKLTPGTTQTTIQYSSAATGFGVAITLKHADAWR